MYAEIINKHRAGGALRVRSHLVEELAVGNAVDAVILQVDGYDGPIHVDSGCYCNRRE